MNSYNKLLKTTNLMKEIHVRKFNSLKQVKDNKLVTTSQQLIYLENNRPPEIYSCLTHGRKDLKIYGKPKKKDEFHSIFDQIMSYKSNYVEKTVLINDEVAEIIAKNVATHTRGDKTTKFYDGDGGFCTVASEVDKLNIFSSITVLEKDDKLTALHSFARDNYLDSKIDIQSVNLTLTAGQYLHDKEGYQSPLARMVPRGDNEEIIPSYSILTTASHSLIKCWTERYLARNNPLGEFYSCRPEMFLIVTPRTYIHLCCGHWQSQPFTRKVSVEEMREINSNIPRLPKLTLTYNVMFQLLFDFCLVEILPRSAFFPWKPYTDFSPKPDEPESLVRRQSVLSKLYKENHEQLMMIYVRPKLKKDLVIDRPDYLIYFLRIVLKTKKRSILSIFEEWIPGSGLVVVDAGYSIFTLVSDLDVVHLLELYNILIRLPEFEQSNFVLEAEISLKSIDRVSNDRSLEELKERIRRKLKDPWKN